MLKLISQTLHHQDCFSNTHADSDLPRRCVWFTFESCACSWYSDSGNSGSVWVCFIFFPNFPGILDFREDFYLSVGTGYLFSPVFYSRCVCQLRPQLWYLEDANTFMPISCVASYTFRNGIFCFRTVCCFESILVSQIKEKFGRERCPCFSHFLIFVMDVWV